VELKEFSLRLSQLRLNKGVSAREMSLDIGQSAGYINGIETGVSFPSMTVFFYICEYFNITPKEFFATDNPNPQEINTISEDLKKLDAESRAHIAAVINALAKK